MTYVREQTSAELAAHMRSLQAMPGWFDPLADRLWQEVQSLQRDNAALMEDAAAQIQIAREAVERAAGLVLEDAAKEFDRRASQWDFQCRGYRRNRQLAVMLREAIRELAHGEPT